MPQSTICTLTMNNELNEMTSFDLNDGIRPNAGSKYVITSIVCPVWY